MKFFHPASQFAGYREGFVFRNGDFGVGYYKDNSPVRTRLPDAAKDSSSTGHAAAATTSAAGKRKIDEVGNVERGSGAKYAALASSQAGATNGGHSSSHASSSVEQLLEEKESEQEAIKELDAFSLKQMLVSFEKKITLNQKLRIKHSDSPEQFMESEFELHQELQNLHPIAAYPSLFPILLQTGAFSSLLGLITHENTDISIAAISLLQEIMDGENTSPEEQAPLFLLIEAFLAQQGIELVVQNLLRLDESNEEDAQGVHHTFTLLENLLDLDSQYATTILSQTHFLAFLVHRLSAKTFDSNKLYASELLSMLIQFAPSLAAQQCLAKNPDTQTIVLDDLLQVLAFYRKRDIKLSEERECAENVFLAISALLLQKAIAEQVLRLEGVELWMRCLQGQELASLMVLSPLQSMVLTCSAAGDRVVEAGGLKFLFAYLSLVTTEGGQHKLRKVIQQRQHALEESLLGIIAQLCVQLHSSPTLSAQRLVHKFTKDDHMYLRYVMKLFSKHSKQLRIAEEEYRQRKEKRRKERERRVALGLQDDEEDEEDEDEEEEYQYRLENGLFAMQQIAMMAGFVCRMDGGASVQVLQESMIAKDSPAGREVLTVLRDLVVTMAQDDMAGEATGEEGGPRENEDADGQQRRKHTVQVCTEWAAVLAAHIERPSP